jgi:ribonuclease D
MMTHREMVRTDAELTALCAELKQGGRFALDTEFLGERTYLPRICLVQIATPEFIVLIDALAVSGLKPLWALVTDPGVTKVLHAAREDLRIAHYGAGAKVPRGIFDTQVASGLLGLPLYPLSYARLVETVMGVKLDKSETRSEWDRRPLTPEQIRYARDDVRYLLEIADKQTALLTRLGRMGWMDEEMERFSNPSTYEPDPEMAYLRIRGSRVGLSARPTAVLRALAAWRERAAADRDVPARSILRDELLVEMAVKSPRRVSDLPRVKGFPLGEEAHLGPGIVAAVESAHALPSGDLPQPLAGGDELSPSERIQVDVAYALAAALSAANNVSPELALSRSDAADLVRVNGISSLLRGWRHELVGANLKSFLQGAARAELAMQDGVLQVTWKKP